MKLLCTLMAGAALAAGLVTPVPAAPVQEPASVMELVRASEAALAATNLVEAATLAQRAIDLDPAWAPAWRQQGLVHLRAERFKEAIPSFRRARARADTAATAGRGLALALWRADQANEAVNAQGAYLRLKPEDAGGWRDLAAWLTRIDRLEPAAAALDRALKLKPDDAAAWREYGILRLRQNKAGEAIPAFERAVKLDAADAAAWRGLSQALWPQGRQDEAVGALQTYLKLKGDDFVAWRDLASWLIRLGRAEQAIPVLDRVLQHNPADVSAWREYGVLHMRQGRPAESIKAFEKALELEPNDPAVLRDLGWCLWTQGRRDEAVRRLEQAVDRQVPSRDRVILQVVARLSEEGRANEALAFYRRTRPGAPLAEVALDLARRGRLQGAEPLLAEAWKAGEQPAATGLYLAYARAINGRSAGVGEHLAPFLEQAGKAAGGEIDLALETLRLCTDQPETPALAGKLDAALGTRRIYDARITDILEKAAEEQRVRGAAKVALDLYRRVLERDPNRSTWIWAFLLAEDLEGPRAALTGLAALQRRATAPVVGAGIDGVRADREGRAADAIERLRASVALDPNQPALRQLLFTNLLRQGRNAEARAEALWFAQRVDEGETWLRSYLAEMWTRLGATEEALAQWQLLRLGRPELTYYGNEAATALYRLNRPDEAMQVLKETVEARPNSQSFELMAEIAAARGRHDEAVQWAARGLEVAPSQGLLRYHAENNEMLGTNHYAAAMTSAATFLVKDPGYIPMNLLAGRAMEALGRGGQARDHQQSLLKRNADFLPALITLSDYATRDGNYRDALRFARRRTEVQPDNPEALRDYATALAQYDRFPSALDGLRRLAGIPLEKAVPVLVYERITDGPYPGRTTVAQIARHIEYLAHAGYVFAIDPATFDAPGATNRVMILLINPEGRVVEALDPVLERYGARVLYATPAGIPADAVALMPDPERVVPRLKSGRWRQVSAGPIETRREVNAEGLLGNPLTHPVQVDGHLESTQVYAARIARELADAARPLGAPAARLLVYPEGDYGQRSLDTPPGLLETVRAAVSNQFAYAVYYDDCGFRIPSCDPLRIPARVVPPAWDTPALAGYLHNGNPLVRARLELAKVLYWNGQFEEANRWFAAAEAAGADPLEVNFNRGLSADRQGDVPTALARLRAAQQLDPSSTRIAGALKQAQDRRRPQADLRIDGWQDNEDRSYLRWGAKGDVFVIDRLRLGATVDRNRWETDGMGREEGTRLGVQGLAFLTPGVWLDAGVWNLEMDDLDNVWGGHAALHVPNPWLSGYLEASATREEIETLEALRADIQADYYTLRTYTRVASQFDLFADVTRTMRTDNNDTSQFDGRLLYRLKEWPYAGIGWRVRLADSDRDPPEYWAPEELQQQQLHVALRGTWRRLRGALSADAGYARERDTDWRFVWGARADADLELTSRLSLNGQLYWFEGPIYERLTWALGLTGRF